MACPDITAHFFTWHAREQMDQRGITEEQVEAVLTAPGQRIEEEPGMCFYQSLVKPGLMLRVLVAWNTTPAAVITAYYSDQLSRYWR